MKYNDVIKLNLEYNKSINILFNENIEYIETTSSKKALKALNYHNAVAIIGPFGSGKSAFLLYLSNLIKEKKFLSDYEVIKVEDVQVITNYGVTSTPALVVDGVVKTTGRVLSVDEIKELIA